LRPFCAAPPSSFLLHPSRSGPFALRERARALLLHSRRAAGRGEALRGDQFAAGLKGRLQRNEVLIAQAIQLLGRHSPWDGRRRQGGGRDGRRGRARVTIDYYLYLDNSVNSTERRFFDVSVRWVAVLALTRPAASTSAEGRESGIREKTREIFPAADDGATRPPKSRPVPGGTIVARAARFNRP
jgi:hypothetical protein